MRIAVLLALCAWACVQSSSAVAAADAPLREIKRIVLPGVRGRIDHMAVDLAGKRLFVAALGNNTAEVIDVDSGRIVQSIGGLQEPQGLLFVPEAEALFVANGGSNALKIFRGKGFSSSTTLMLEDDNDNIRYDRQAQLAYVGTGGDPDSALAIVDAHGREVPGRIALSGHPESFQLERNAVRVFVNVPTAGVIEVADRIQRKVVARWKVGGRANFAMALDDEHRRLFVVTRHPAKLWVLDTRDGRTVASLDTVGDADDVFYDEELRRIYVSGGEGHVAVVRQESADRYAATARIQTRDGARTAYFVPQWRMLFVALPAKPGAVAEIRVFETVP
ncbi:MAG TPA: hypothetical protein VFB20_17725 [Burkholderiales bacterium]|nr:hypothetical protein [Burkholderiales bacterium]